MARGAAQEPGLSPYVIDDFRGLDTFDVQDLVPHGFSPANQNVSFAGGGTNGASRQGTSTYFDLTAGTDVFKAQRVVTVDSNYLLFLMQDNKLYYAPDTGGARTLLVSPTGSPTGFNAVPFGEIVMLFFHDSNFGVSGPYVWDTSVLPTVQVDLASIAPPSIGSLAAADGSAGTVTAGVHQISVIFQTRTGYVSAPCANPISYTAPGAKKINLTNIPLFPTGGGHVAAEVTTRYIVMTAAGLTSFYVAATINDNTTTSLTFDISDAQLIAELNVDVNFTFSSPLPVCAKGIIYHSRLIMVGYGAFGLVAYVSEVGLPQTFRGDVGFLDESGYGNWRLTNLFQMRDILYLVGALGIYSRSDNGQDPNTWPQETVSLDVGTISYDGVSNESDEDFVIIDDFKGLYLFTGQPPTKESLLINPTWATGNIPHLNTARTYIDTLNRRILSFRPTGSATTPNTVFVCDYTEGWKKAKWTTWNTAGTAWRDFIINQPDILIATASSLVAKFDASAITDQGTAINWFYRFEQIMAAQEGLTYFDGMYLRGLGAGALNVTVYDTNGTLLATLPTFALATNTIADWYNAFMYTYERVFFQIGQNDSSSYCHFDKVVFDIAPDGVRPH